MDSEFYVSVDIISQFKKVQELTQDPDFILEALKDSLVIQVDLVNRKIRASGSRTTLILRDISPDITEEEITQLFDAELKPLSLRRDVNNVWFAHFEDENRTKQAYLLIREKKLKGQSVKVRIKSGQTTKAFSEAHAISQPRPPTRYEQVAAPYFPYYCYDYYSSQYVESKQTVLVNCYNDRNEFLKKKNNFSPDTKKKGVKQRKSAGQTRRRRFFSNGSSREKKPKQYMKPPTDDSTNFPPLLNLTSPNLTWDVELCTDNNEAFSKEPSDNETNTISLEVKSNVNQLEQALFNGHMAKPGAMSFAQIVATPRPSSNQDSSVDKLENNEKTVANAMDNENVDNNNENNNSYNNGNGNNSNYKHRKSKKGNRKNNNHNSNIRNSFERSKNNNPGDYDNINNKYCNNYRKK
ncbi:probable serine/threonine-protein kinase MARK-A [Zophobas morio]|uniref:probable serine/threonine-protein kinase MARK-A n=1 Tax=Zophobas morio TaxID=2755281 RepID=UPI00308297C6